MIPRKAVLDKELSHAEFRALAAVAVHRNSGAGWSYPSQAKLAEELGLKAGENGENAVRKLLRRPIERGYLERIAGSGRDPSRYRIIYDQLPPADDAGDAGAVNLAGTASVAGAPPANLAPSAPAAVAGCTIGLNQRTEPKVLSLRSSTDDRKATDDLFTGNQQNQIPRQSNGSPSKPSPSNVGSDVPALASPSLLPQASTRGAAQPPRAKLAGATDGFLEFWDVYPKKVAKPKALAAWTKAIDDGASSGQIILGLRQFPFSLDTQYHPHPATWLNGKRWLDEAPTTPPTSAPPLTNRMTALKAMAQPRSVLGSLHRVMNRQPPTAAPPAFDGTTIDHNPGDISDDRN